MVGMDITTVTKASVFMTLFWLLEIMEAKVSLKVRVQKLGTSLSNMVMPNIGAFIAWGVLTALFIPADTAR